MWFCLATFLLTLVLCIKNYGVRLNFDRSGFTFCTGFFHVHVHAEGDSLILRFSVLSAESSSMARPRQSTMPYQVWRSNRTATANHGGKRRRFHHDQYNNVKSRSRNNWCLLPLASCLLPLASRPNSITCMVGLTDFQVCRAFGAQIVLNISGLSFPVVFSPLQSSYDHHCKYLMSQPK